MSLAHTFSLRLSLTTAMAALGLVLLSVGPAAAQSRPSIPLDARGYQTTLAVQDYYQRQESAPARPAPAAPAPAAQQSEPRYVTITGPDGRVRTFQLEGPITVAPSPARVVHWGAR